MEGRHRVVEARYPDDERTHVYTCATAIDALTGERFDLCLLDHDLGEGDSGTEVARAIAAMDPDRHPRDVIIHSHNPVGAERMRDILRDAGIRCRIEPFSSFR